MILLDTNVVSEFMRPTPSARVLDWLDGQRRGDLRIAAPVLFELEYGLHLLAQGKRRSDLSGQLARFLAQWLDGAAILPFDGDAARRAAGFVAARQATGRPLAALDAQIAGIAAAHDAVLATRDTADFAGLALRLVDPWRT
jgi:toxin FitB